MIFFLYGAGHTFVDVTAAVLDKCLYEDRIYIPAGDGNRATLFGDPLFGAVKAILFIRNDGDILAANCYGSEERIWISLSGEDLSGRNRIAHRKRITLPPPTLSLQEKLDFIQSQLVFTGGDIRAEWVEQMNSLEFLDPNAKVLELGSGPGRNTMMISCILNDESNLVTLECNPKKVEVLRQNRLANKFRFHSELAALSYRKLMYNPELELTLPGDELRHGYEWINTMTLEDIKAKYGIEFDTLVADCEGALYYILQDNQRLLENIGTVILESDYLLAEHKWAVEDLFKRYGLQRVKSWRLDPATVELPKECVDSFWEVWKR